MTQDPTQRLRTDPRASERLRRDLEYARDHTVDIDVEAGLRKLGETLAASEDGTGLASNGDSATSAAPLPSIATKWWAWSLVGATTLGFVWWTQNDTSPPAAQRPGVPERSATPEEREASSEVPGLATDLARGPALEDGVAEQAMGPPPDERMAVRGAAEAANAGSADGPDGSKAAGRRGRVERASSARATANRATRGPHPSQAASASAEATERSAATPTQAPSDPYSGIDEGGPAVDAAATSAVAASVASVATAAATQTSSDGSHGRPEGEVEHLAGVRRLLSHAPAQALRAAREGQATFTDGLFREERAALIVFALARLGRADEALREARGYLRAYPRGPFAVPVNEIVTRFEARKP